MAVSADAIQVDVSLITEFQHPCQFSRSRRISAISLSLAQQSKKNELSVEMQEAFHTPYR